MVEKNERKVAVALSYDKEENEAPRVVAKGIGEVAKNIIKTAKENDVASIEDKELASKLFKLDIDDEIPSELYTAVAEILTYVYKLDTKKGV